MRSRRTLLLAWAIAGLGAHAAWAQDVGEVLISRTTAARHGLQRAWFAHVELDRSSEEVAYITRQAGTIFVQTSRAVVHAIDAETGRTQWAIQIGRHGLLSLAPAANEKVVAVVNGSTLYLVDRKNGRLKSDHVLSGAPGAGPALSDKRVFVPMVNGLVESYLIDEPLTKPKSFQSTGRIFVQPIVTTLTVAWTTDRGHFYIVDREKNEIRLRLETDGSIESPPVYWPPYVYATSLSGFVYAIDEVTGQTAWKFAAGDPVGQSPLAVGGMVYVVKDNGGLYQLDGATGDPRWFAAGITQMLSVSPTRVYASDRFQRLAILDRKSGALLDTLPLGTMSFRLMNRETDRIYLCTRHGQLECLHEVGLTLPAVHKLPPPPVALGAEKKDADAKAPAKKKAADAEEGADTETGEGEADATEDAAKKPADKEAASTDEEEVFK